MNELIKIESSEIAGITVLTCNARDLWKFVESKQDFSTWIKGRIDKYGFIEGEDYLLHKFVEQLPSGAKHIIDYHLTIETGKELAMVENNAKGREVRRYFIECERKAKATQAIDPMQVLSDPVAMRGLLLTYTEKVLALENKVNVLEPKAEALDRLAASDGSQCITDAAKALKIQPKSFFQKLQQIKWIYKRAGGKNWLGYQDKIQAGYIEHKITTVSRSDGSEKSVEQALLTPKGIARLSMLLERLDASPS